METLKLSQLEIGDILAYHKPHGFLPKNIQRFMKMWAKIHYATSLPKYYNHTLMMINPKELKVAEAIGKGFSVHSIWRKYNRADLQNMLVFRLKDELNEQEKAAILIKRAEMADKNIEYEILNFLWWVLYIMSNGKIDLSPGRKSKKEKRVFCFEASAMLRNSGRELFEKPDKVTTVDMQMDERLNQYYLEA